MLLLVGFDQRHEDVQALALGVPGPALMSVSISFRAAR